MTVPPDLAAKFKKLTLAQHRLMTFQSTDHNGLITNSTKKMCERMIALGLVEKLERVEARFGITITWYEVPIQIHMEYCRWCSEQEEAKEGF